MNSRGDLQDGARDAADEVKRAATTASRTRQAVWVSRAGMATRGVVYLLLGALAILVSMGQEQQSVDQKGAFTELAARPGGSVVLVVLAAGSSRSTASSWCSPGGSVVLVVLAAGLASYALWQLLRAVRGPGGREDEKLSRLIAAGVAVIYASLTFSVVTVLLGSREPSSEGREVLTARVMSYPGGVVLVVLVGLAIIAIGVSMVYRGLTTDFMKHFSRLSRTTHVIVKELGRVGAVGRGIVIGLVGILVVDAALTFQPEQAGGIDDAFRAVLSQPYGRPLALGAAAAFLAFGLYGLAEAKYREVQS